MSTDPNAVLTIMEALRADVVAATASVGDVHPAHTVSARNLAHFVAMRSTDLRDLQDDLASLGLSSLGRCEAHVLTTIDAVIGALRAITGRSRDPGGAADAAHVGPSFDEGRNLLDHHTEVMFGPTPQGRRCRIMVTLPSEARLDPRLVTSFVERGMDVARINCAHDDAATWTTMAGFVRAAAAAAGREVKVLMDLAGPKLRTGEMAPGPAVVRVKPDRDDLGRVSSPARAWLIDHRSPPSMPVELDSSGWPVPRVFVPVEPSLLHALAPGDQLRCTDGRGKQRRLRVVSVDEHGALVITDQTAYLAEGTLLIRETDQLTGAVTGLSARPGVVLLAVGDLVELVAEHDDGAPADDAVRVSCTLPEAIDALERGHRVAFDDGVIGGVVESLAPGRAWVRIVSAPPGGAKLRAEKGINLPDTHVPVPALTADDLTSLDAIVQLADMVALSFVRTVGDIELLQAELAARDAGHLGLVLKIETVEAFRNLPELLVAAMRTESVGVMIARGDLAVEAGYERLAELQEEILWLSEAAHLPVIWATQVLDQLAKTGRPSRSEITDAAMSERAECVMLNKGRHIPEAITTLNDILGRMGEHQAKKRQLLRPLRSWGGSASA